MKTIDFTQTGGYRFKQTTLDRMQSGYIEVLTAFIRTLGVPDVGNYILSGCEISGANITDGFMYIDGELCPFSETNGDLLTKIKKQTTLQTIAFKNGSNQPVWKTTTAVVDASGVELQEFERISIVIDGNYVHTDNNFTAALLAKLNGIEAGAEKNVQTNWNETNPLSDAYLIGKPQGNLMTYLAKGKVYVGDIRDGLEITISFPDVGTVDYTVLAQLNGSNTDLGKDNDVTYVIGNQTSNSFKVSFDEYASHRQMMTFSYFLIPNT